MQNTSEVFKPTLPNRTGCVVVQGSFNELYDIIKDNNLNIEFNDLVTYLRKYTDKIEKLDQRSVFQAYYWRKLSVVDIRTCFGYHTNDEVIKLLDGGLEAYIMAIYHDVGVKE